MAEESHAPGSVVRRNEPARDGSRKRCGALARGEVDADVGLCSVCGHASRQPNARGNLFWRCLAADEDARLLRYPPLPVVQCHAFAREGPADR